jgi:hypothetical protein
VASLSVAIRALGSPLVPHLESNLDTYLYSGSTPIADMDESNCKISFNILKKSTTSLPAVIESLGSPLSHHPESDLATDLYSGSILIANMDEFDHQINFNLLTKSTISPSVAIGASGSPLESHPERDLAADLHSGSTSIAIKDETNHCIRFT